MLLCTKRRRRRGGSIKPPSQSDLVLWGDGEFRQVGNLTNDYLVFDYKVAPLDFNLTINNILFESLVGTRWLFNQYTPDTNGRFRIEISNGNLSIQIGSISAIPIVLQPLKLYKKISFVYEKGIMYTTIDSFSHTSNINIGVQQNVDLAFGDEVDSALYRDLNAIVESVEVDGELFKLDAGSGTILTGNERTTATLTDGSPFDFWNEKINISKALDQNLVIVKKTDSETYSLNLASDATLTALGFTNAYLTRTQIASLHNGTTIFTSPDDGLEPRVLAWPADKVLTLDEIYKANLYVRRYS